MYYIYGISGPSLLIESTDSMIMIAIDLLFVHSMTSCKEMKIYIQITC